MNLEELYRVRSELMMDIELGIDTADTWIDLALINFAINEKESLTNTEK